MTERRFTCTAGGAVLRGRTRLRRLLAGLALVLAGISGILWIEVLIVAVMRLAFAEYRHAGLFAPWGTALVTLLAAAVPWTAWRMSGDLDLLWLALDGARLTIQMRRRRELFAVAGAAARRLTPEEIGHLERLATNGGVTAGTGGFESHLLGELDLYAGDLANAVLVDLGETRLVVTPDDPEGFLEALSSP